MSQALTDPQTTPGAVPEADGERLDRAVRDALGLLESTDVHGIAWGQTEEWDSVAHMQLVAALEATFGIMLDTDDVIAMSDYAEIRRIVGKNLELSLRLDGQVAYVTGSTRGIGRAVAATLAEAGAAVVVNGHRDPDEPGRYAAELSERYGTECIGVAADQRDSDAIKAAYATIHKTYGRLDILANNAGIVEDALLGMISEPSIVNTYDTDALAIVRNMQLASRLMRRNNSGSIINTSSIMGVYGNAGEVVYASAKAAVIGATKAAAKELAPYGIRVNAIAPGFIDTDLTRALAPRVFEERKASIGMGRVGRPQDVANVVLFLASSLSEYVTGQVIGIDGAMLV